jgi:multidrug transporter EmrE-like cation transporter
MNIFPLILAGVILNATAQLLLKEGMNRIGHFAFSWANVWPIGLQVASNPFIIIGLCCYIFSVVFWLLVLSRTDVSYAYPLASIGYIVTALAAKLFLHETFSTQRIIAIAIIMVGVFFLTRTSS